MDHPPDRPVREAATSSYAASRVSSAFPRGSSLAARASAAPVLQATSRVLLSPLCVVVRYSWICSMGKAIHREVIVTNEQMLAACEVLAKWRSFHSEIIPEHE